MLSSFSLVLFNVYTFPHYPLFRALVPSTPPSPPSIVKIQSFSASDLSQYFFLSFHSRSTLIILDPFFSFLILSFHSWSFLFILDPFFSFLVFSVCLGFFIISDPFFSFWILFHYGYFFILDPFSSFWILSIPPSFNQISSKMPRLCSFFLF